MTTGEPQGVSRRRVIKEFGIAAGAAWAAPVTYDSFATPAAAAGTELLNALGYTSTAHHASVGANIAVNYTLRGAIGGGAQGAGSGKRRRWQRWGRYDHQRFHPGAGHGVHA